MDGVLVPGTETGVGKTLVAAALLCSRPGAVNVKPVQTGPARQPADVDVVSRLTVCDVRQGRGFEASLARPGRDIRVRGLVINGWPDAPDLAARAAREGLAAMAPVLAIIPQLGATRPQDLPGIAW
ncbi:MAG TPA: AAA family ATPase [Euzebya sp.]|nr:AAA family ATPase [Euzebya sp.]